MSNNKGNSDLGFIDKPWATANKLRGSVESAEYKHIDKIANTYHTWRGENTKLGSPRPIGREG